MRTVNVVITGYWLLRRLTVPLLEFASAQAQTGTSGRMLNGPHACYCGRHDQLTPTHAFQITACFSWADSSHSLDSHLDDKPWNQDSCDIIICSTLMDL